MNIPNFPQITLRDATILFLVSVAFALPVILVGPPVGSPDLPHHLTITAAWQNAIETGTLIPDWVAAENNGYGAVNARYYPPLFHLTYAALLTLVNNWGYGLFLTILLWSFIGGVGIYVWSFDLTGSRAVGLFAAGVFAFTPYHANQFYHSFMWGEFVSLSIVPFAFYFIRNHNLRPGILTWLGITISTALLVLSNVPQLIVAAVCLSIYFLLTLEIRTAWRSGLSTAGAIAVALILASFFWVRVVLEVSWLYIGLPNIDPLYDYKNNFLLAELNPWGGAGELTPLFGTMFLLFTVVTVSIALFASRLYRKLWSDRDLRAVCVVFLTSTIMCTLFSKFIWDLIPVLQKIQFPWRFLSVASLAGSVLVGIALGFINKETWRTSQRGVLVVAGSFMIMLTFTIKQDIMASSFMSNGDFGNYAAACASKIGLEHWRPTWTTKETFKQREIVSTGIERQVTVQAWNERSHEFQVSQGEPTTARTAITYFPHWKATFNGEPLEVGEAGGALTIQVPESAGTVSLKFVEPRYTIASRWISVLSFLILVVGLLAFYLRKKIRQTQLPVLSV